MPKVYPPYLPFSETPPKFWALGLPGKTFVDDTGNVLDAVGVTRAGTRAAGVSFSGSSPDDMVFDGSASSYVSFADTGKNGETTFRSGSNDFSILVQVKTTSGAVNALLSFGSAGAAGAWGGLYNNGGKFGVSNWGESVIGATSFTNNAWRVGICTYNAASKEAKVYIDGSLDATGTLSSGINISLLGTAYIGQWGNGQGGYYGGTIGTAAYWDYIISGQQIADWSSDPYHELTSLGIKFRRSMTDRIGSRDNQ